MIPSVDDNEVVAVRASGRFRLTAVQLRQIAESRG